MSDAAHPSWRTVAVGVYRLWRDLGYAVGAILAGGIADMFGIAPAIVAIAVRMKETLFDVTYARVSAKDAQFRIHDATVDQSEP